MARQQSDMLSLGVLLVIVAIVLIAYAAKTVTGLDQVLALIVALYGVWTIVLAGIRSGNPEKYGRGAYSTLIMGVVLTAIGGLWFLTISGMSFIITLALLLVIIGIVAVVSALPSMRKK